MNHNEEVPDFLGEFLRPEGSWQSQAAEPSGKRPEVERGDMLPADVLKKVNELLEQLHRKDKEHQGSPVFIYAPGSQYVDKQFNIGASPPTPLPLGRRTLATSGTQERARGADGAEASKSLPDVLATDKAMALWNKAQQAGYVDEHYQPLLSRTQAALLADAMAERLGIKEKWKVYGDLWKRNNMRGDYTRAMNQRQSLDFQDKLKRLFSTDNEENTGKT